MSAANRSIGQPYTSNKLATKHVVNPFDGDLESDDDSYEWWDEEEATTSRPVPGAKMKTASPPHLPRSVETTTALSNSRPLNRRNTRKIEKRYSVVQKPRRNTSRWRKKKQRAQAGIQLVTDFSTRSKAVLSEPQPQNAEPHVARFIDLAALQALNRERTPKESSGVFWRSRKNKGEGAAMAEPPRNPASVPSNLMPPAIDPAAGLSPVDRPIFIGLTIPSSDVSVYSTSPQTASLEIGNIVRSYEQHTPTLQVPETPAIVITPALEGSTWSPFDESNRFVRGTHTAVSSFYSQASNEVPYGNAPPVPKVPASILQGEQQRLAAQKSCFSPDSDDGTVWEDESAHTSRVMSSCTIFEEDVSPILARTRRGVSVSDGSRPGRHTSVSSVGTQRRSKGWWNYITTPFLTRSNTFASMSREANPEQPPALPSLAMAAAAAHDMERDAKSWEKQFSPVTPKTATTIQSEWWNHDGVDSKSPVRSPISPIDQKNNHKSQPSAATVQFFLADGVFPHPPSGDGNPTATSSQRALPSSPLSNERPLLDSSFQPGNVHSGNLSGQQQGDNLENPPNNCVPPGMRSNNPLVQPQREQSVASSRGSLSSRRQAAPPSPFVVVLPASAVTVNIHEENQTLAVATPPPAYSPPPRHVRRYRAILPPGHALNLQQPMSPGPITPGIQNAMAGPGAVQMSNVPLTPAPTRGPINLNSSYPSELPPRQGGGGAFFTADSLRGQSSKARKAEAKRRRYEKEDAAAHRAGGWWRGRGCIPKNGCYGRKGPEGRKKRRCYLALIIGFLMIIALAVVLATTLHRKSSPELEASQWLNLTGFPPIFAGLSTIIAPVNTVSNTGCVFPATVWSCSLPKEDQASVAPNAANQPNFLLNIQWDNSIETNKTFANVTGNPNLPIRSLGGNAISARQFVRFLLHKAKRAITIVPSPAPPSFAEEFFLGNTTDGIVSSNKAGESTPFYISFVPAVKSAGLTSRSLETRHISSNSSTNTSSPFIDLDNFIPKPSLNADGSAAPANLLPLPTQQPIRLYDRGLPTEHYGFYTYYDRSIFLKSLDLLNSTSPGEVPADASGGASADAAGFRCTWSQTRFLVQMWTRMNTTARLLNSTHQTAGKNASTDFLQPGSFPYPVTVTTDRHGGNPNTKMIYCYAVDARGGLVKDSGKIINEQRFFGGAAVNPADALFRNGSDTAQGGFDGGSGGCGCQWDNFEALTGKSRRSEILEG